MKSIFTGNPDIIIRSNLVEVTIRNSSFSIEKHKKLLDALDREKSHFLTISQGVFETTFIASRELKNIILSFFDKNDIIGEFVNLASITIRLPKKTATTPGVFYYMIKSLSWEGINIVEIVSTYTELTIILNTNDINHAFTVIKSCYEE
jgi:aspartokinase